MISFQETNPEEQTKTRSRLDFWIAVLVFWAAFVLLSATSSRLPPTWDEGETAQRATEIARWTRLDGALDGARFSQDELIRSWKGTVSVEGHPQFPVILIALGRMFAPTGTPGVESVRCGPILFFSLVLGAVWYRMKTEFGRTAAFFGVASILLIPRLFAHAQIAAWDSTLTASWLLAWATFPAALNRRRGAIFFGICLGLVFSSKFSGFAAVLPFAAWMILRLLSDRTFFEKNRMELLKRIGLAAVFSLLVFYLLNPPIWRDPIGGFGIFFRLNTQRDFNVAILFLGGMHDLYHSLPWYNTIFWTAITVPIGLAILFVFGTIFIFRDASKRWAGLLIFLNFSTLLIVRAFPGTPVHDGVRLFVSAFPFLALLAGIGAAGFWNLSTENNSVRKRIAARIVVSAVYAACLFNMIWFAPQWLSYYNILIGGLPGAVRSGMEPTYYWDGLDDEVFDWIDANLKPDENLGFSIGSYRSFALGKRMRRPYFIASPETTVDEMRLMGIRYYVLQRRPSAEFSRDVELIERGTPVFTKTIRHGGFGPWNLARVPIIEIYDLTKYCPGNKEER